MDIAVLGDQPNCVCLSRKNPSQMMGAAAGFHRNDVGRELRGQAHDSFCVACDAAE